MPKQPGPDLPPADAHIDVDVFSSRWPTAAEKTELEEGCPVFYGEWDERDVQIAQRAYPGRTVRLDQPVGQPGTLRVLPAPRREDEDVTEDVPRAGFAEAVPEISDKVRKTPVGAVEPRRIVKIDVPGE